MYVWQALFWSTIGFTTGWLSALGTTVLVLRWAVRAKMRQLLQEVDEP